MEKQELPTKKNQKLKNVKKYLRILKKKIITIDSIRLTEQGNTFSYTILNVMGNIMIYLR